MVIQVRRECIYKTNVGIYLSIYIFFNMKLSVAYDIKKLIWISIFVHLLYPNIHTYIYYFIPKWFQESEREIETTFIDFLMNAIDTDGLDEDEDRIDEIELIHNRNKRLRGYSTQNSPSQTQHVKKSKKYSRKKNTKSSLGKKARISNRTLQSQNKYDWTGDCEDVGYSLEENEEDNTESEEYN